jgi:hypothetical protein
MDSNPSAAAKADGHLLSFHDDWNFALSGRNFEHCLHVLGALLDIHIVMSLMGRPGPVRVGSARLAVNNHLCAHLLAPFLWDDVLKVVSKPSLGFKAWAERGVQPQEYIKYFEDRVPRSNNGFGTEGRF